ncbi:hypothetical protein SFRURICE_007690 [Spodoptera frugiperda]|nr:hypothetical protein SFRURICE_007690 [Spodoptera frugiperda]
MERMAHQKDEKQRVWRMPPIVLPPLPKYEKATPSPPLLTTTEALPPVIKTIIQQLQGSKVLESNEDYELFMKKIKKDFIKKQQFENSTQITHTGSCPMNKAQ